MSDDSKKKEMEIADAVECLLDVAVERHTQIQIDGDSETFLQCHMCGTWEDHKDDCPVPLLQKWLDK